MRDRKKKNKSSVFRERGKKLANLRQVYRISASNAPVGQAANGQYGKPPRNEGPMFGGGIFGLSNCLAAFEEQEHGNSSTNVSVNPEVCPVDSDQIESGARIVALLEDLPIYHRLMDYRYSTCKPWVFSQRLSNEVVMPLYALRDELQRSSSNTDKSLRRKASSLSRRLFENTANPVETWRNMTPSEYFSSTAMRWETIGLMFSCLASVVIMIPDDYEHLRLDDGIIDKNELNSVAMDAAEACLAFCDDAGVMSDPLSWLLLRNTLLLDAVYGQSDLRPWRKLGDLANMVFALGWHRLQQSDCMNIPFFLYEIRKRVIVAAYALDKELATNLGRPPQIAWQYCNIQLPLDLSFDEIFTASTSEEQEKYYLRKIGTDGWNIEGEINSGSRGRLKLMFSTIREKILEVSLSPHPGNKVQKLLEIYAEHQQMRSNLPPSLDLQCKLLPNATLINIDSTGESIANIQLEFLNNDFMIYRILAKETGNIQNRDSFLNLAQEIMTKLLSVISRAVSERGYRNSPRNLHYIGLSCAGVLARELLQQSRHQRQHLLPRSEIIQNLTIFASHLEKCREFEGNDVITKRGLDAVRGILDRVLSPPVAGSETSLSAPKLAYHDENGIWPTDENAFLQHGLEIIDDFDLAMMAELDSIDWAQESLLLNFT
ncbi:C6 transcription factor, putative [Talaromyces islandicus]|uniref:C6 transcription factor, putative n=1 Tax=Talaromyces islandicus TaxID=28573 RepID=A0A0U1M3A1_TALIS|nr:C6 transcription factor, putative [Talaromyces islandicus]